LIFVVTDYNDQMASAHPKVSISERLLCVDLCYQAP